MTTKFSDNLYHIILLDIEGTTTPVDFVYKTLFPFARNQVAAFLSENLANPDVRSILDALREENREDKRQGLDAPVVSTNSKNELLSSVVAYVHWLIEIDRKSTPLKALQGLIWEAGYASGELRSEIFADVPLAFARWREQGTAIGIFSSGSILAQKLLFAHTPAGDLTPFILAYFDTNIGAKKAAESYRRIAVELRRPPQEILFVSDVTAELDAAAAAGMKTALSARPGNAPQSASKHPVIYSFDEFFQ